MGIGCVETYLLLWSLYGHHFQMIIVWFSEFQLVVLFSYFYEISFPLTGSCLSSQVSIVLLLLLALQIISSWCPIIKWENLRQGDPNCDTKWERWCYHKSRCFSFIFFPWKVLTVWCSLLTGMGERENLPDLQLYTNSTLLCWLALIQRTIGKSSRDRITSRLCL